MGSLLILSSMSLVILLLIWSYFQRVPLGDNPSTEASVSLLSATAKLYIVDLGERQYEDPQLVTASHHETLSSVLGSKEKALNSMVYSYKHCFSGFAATLTPSQARQLAELPEVISVRPSRTFPLHTTRSWDYLGLRFNDDGYGPVPSRWKGVCEIGVQSPISCNRKIIGARYYSKDVDPAEIARDYDSPRDANGHGTHTASTAAGSLVSDASFHGLGAGTARGGAPRARLAIYKVCWGSGRCGQADILQAIDDAVDDGVDILSLSIGGDGYFPASLGAVRRGMTVIFSGGNDGPVTQTLNNDVPWVITVAASTIDRSFSTVITLGDKQTVVGQSLFYDSQGVGFKDLVVPPTCSEEDIQSRDVVGKMVLCADSGTAGNFYGVLRILQSAKAAGVIFGRFPRSELGPCERFICVLVDKDVHKQIWIYSAKTSSPVVKVSPALTSAGIPITSPRVAAFSSRGPSIPYPDLLKPDITAPGFLILAAVKDSYEFMSGTSMACPHVSGVAALLKAVHPEWSHAAIKSALVTTAYTTDAYDYPVEAEAIPRKLADAFDYGGGHIDPNKAADPGLVYDIDPDDYCNYFRCTKRASSLPSDDIPGLRTAGKRMYDLNLPSISIPDLKETPVTVERTVTNVGDKKSKYKPVVRSPPGVNMVVEPSVLEFKASKEKLSFKVTFTSLHKVQGGFTFGSLTWMADAGKHTVRIPIAVRVIIVDSFSDTS
ncbi:hypothetical protein OPV22_010807 [Ensete ventricosum]|uniref:Subtilisin-like protease fibronectin type-III domain-containing protein n=1 Tax=Ensete ventricosum TaxID=4639 RepID=A0AAV8Q3I6_ENSVE|nr:hypothetical protein OPV22_010807 [Ensete ventricosum]